MPVGFLHSSFNLSDYDGFILIIDPVNNSKITHPNAVEGLKQFLTTNGTGGIFKILDGF